MRPMFTGLVEAVGRITDASGTSPRRLVLDSPIPHDEIRLGDSIAIDGCCLTVVDTGRPRASGEGSCDVAFEAATETLARTTLGQLQAGDAVHLERALRVGDRLGGHLVAGHVDGIGRLASRDQRDSALYLGIEVPTDIARLSAPRGSITLAGVSLTITDVQDRIVSVGLIPHTVAVTNLGNLGLGNPINVEADLIARYVDRLLEPHQPAAASTQRVSSVIARGLL